MFCATFCATTVLCHVLAHWSRLFCATFGWPYITCDKAWADEQNPQCFGISEKSVNHSVVWHHQAPKRFAAQKNPTPAPCNMLQHTSHVFRKLGPEQLQSHRHRHPGPHITSWDGSPEPTVFFTSVNITSGTIIGTKCPQRCDSVGKCRGRFGFEIPPVWMAQFKRTWLEEKCQDLLEIRPHRFGGEGVLIGGKQLH